MNTTTKILIAAILITLISGTAAALVETEWAYGRANVAPDGIEYAYWDFEEGSYNLAPFNNKHPEIAAFMSVISDPGNTYDTDEPSYVYDGGRAMHIYPWDFYRNPDGTPMDFIYIVNGHYAFAPRTSPNTVSYVPGRDAYIVFKDDTHYVSFLVCTGDYLSIKLYGQRGSVLHDVTIARTIDRVGIEPSNFTRFSVHIPGKSITAMKLKGSVNSWHIDDLIIGGDLEYLPDPPKDYNYASDRMKELTGAKFLEYGLGYDLVMGQFLTAEQIKDEIADPCWNPETKELFFGIGIYDENAIVWAFNVDEDVVNWGDINNQAKHDFTVHVEYGEQRPGDVFFLDYDADSCYDEVGIFIEPQHNPETGAMEDIIRIIPEAGVHYESSEYIHALYGVDTGTTIDSFMDCRRLPDHPKGGHSPYPKIPSKFFI